MKTTTPKRTPEQTERVELVRTINRLIGGGIANNGLLEIRDQRWHRAVWSAPTPTLQSIIDHLEAARALIKLVGSADIVSVPEVKS